MRYFLLNILLALAWAALTGDFSPINLLAGFVFGYAALWIMQFIMAPSSYFSKVPTIILFLANFVWELFKANIRMAYFVLVPDKMNPGIIGIPLDISSDSQITLLANMITLTPGTLSLEVSTDHRVLYVHNVQVTDPDEFREEIKEGFEQQVLEVTQ
jgi:multicomponent Na+:H+ antiporter subunit E